MNETTQRYRAVAHLCAAFFIWLGVGLSLGWYYTFTYYGRTGVPMPTIEPCAALVLYYFSVLNVRTEIQAIHWMLSFPIAGALWPLALQAVARYMKIAAPPFYDAYFRLSCAAVPLVLPAPWMTWVAGYKPGAGFAFSRMLLVALRREEQSPWSTLTPLYLAFGFAVLAMQLYTYRRMYPAPLSRALTHYLASAALVSAIAAVAGAAAALPLRLILE